ncbi:hypothetical protein IX51_07580 [uncultured archaeon]|nr:hypothetical protein IX51_07580 [uncultured archaeon]HKJ97249.1 sulfurtransferase [Thermoplasmataceae archaeon]
MSLTNRTIVETGWLAKHLREDDIVVADCRYNLMDSSEGRKKYLSGHIPGAYFVDMETDLTGEKKEHGGRHPIPDKDDFSKKMSAIGVEKGKTVVAYDDDLSGASRLWWLLNYFGHDHVYVLNGGIGKWMEEGREISLELPVEMNSRFEPAVNHDLLFDVHTVRSSRSNVIVDSRAPERYAGKHEPIDFKAGHIPGAVNIFYRDAMNPEGKIKERDDLRKLYKNTGPSPVIYCGSGITSCVNILGMAVIGIEAKLYPGSWSDWISYPENDVETEAGS